ncbi:porin family protein [Fodinibius sp. SL11]|uniref:porin family protein n=1 Tax=Fodinibius sp. SL11 TaxID=3425690 RepID=UPI003F883B98
MKTIIKSILILSICLWGFQNTHAQDIRFGAKAGADFSNWHGKDVKDADLNTHIRFHAGAFAEIPVAKAWNLESGLYISQKGFEANQEILGFNFDVTNTSTYLDLPVLAKYGMTKNFNVFLGPQFSYLLNNKVPYEFEGEKDTDKGVSGFKKFDLGAVGGMGYQFNNGLLVSANYDFGLLKMDDVTNTKAYNRVIKISAGYRF